MDAETWSTGPKSEVGRQAEAEKNDLLFAAYQKDMSTLPSEVQDLSRKKFNNPAKQREVQNMLFTREFKSILMREGRVIARRV